MSKKIFVFPGQGSQIVGMGKDFYDNFIEAKEVFQEVDNALNQNLTKIIFEGSAEDLTLTENTQPALMAVSIAILRTLLKQSGKKLNDFSDYVAGHSLGEYTALCAAGAFNLSDCARLLKLRGKSMQQAVPQGKGAMAAVIGLDFANVEKLTNQANSSDEPCEIANDNSDGQVVISGSVAGIDKAENIAKELGAKRFLKLPVSAPFHSSLMKPAQEIMRQALAETNINIPAVPVIANVSAKITSDVNEIKNLLTQQVTGRVRWRESVEYMAQTLQITKATEIGAGKVLSGLIKRGAKEIETSNIEKIQDLENFLNLSN
ncbi:MAG: ACP S-malonyltransferase [Rickettsiales bacterium]|nr:ACP S-malonyltransferase [Rickettsiales bacterium]